MTTIKIKNHHLPATTQITLTNPVFDPENIERLYTYSFTIALTPEVRKLFKHTNRLDSPDGKMRYDAELHIEGQLFEAGEIEIQSSSTKSLSVVFKNKSIRLKERMLELKLRDLNMNVQAVTPDFSPTYYVSLDIPSPIGPYTHFAIQVKEQVFSAAIGTGDLTNLINDINAVFPNLALEPALGQPATQRIIFFAAWQIEGFTLTVQPNIGTASTYLYFEPTLSTVMDEAERLANSFATHAQTTIAGNDTHVFPTVFARNLYDGKNTEWNRYINYYDVTNNYPISILTATNVPEWKYSFSPAIFVSAIFDKILQELDIDAIDGNFFSFVSMDKLIVFSNKLLDFLYEKYQDVTDFDDDEIMNSFQGEFQLADFLPDISSFEFLDFFRTTFALFFRQKERRLTIQTRKSKINVKEKDWTKYFDPDFTKHYRESEAYTLDWERYGEENTHPGQLEDIDGGPEAKKYTSKWWTLFNSIYRDSNDTGSPVTRTWQIPELFKKGNSSAAGVEEKQDPVLLFYHGLQADNVGNTYPFASHANKDFAGNSISPYSLDWNGADGRYETFWKEIIEIETKGQEVEKIARIPLAEILELKKDWNAKIGIYSPDGKITAHITSISFLSNEKGIGLAKVKMIKV